MCGVNDMDEKKVESIIFGLKETIAEQKAEIERLAKVEIDLIGKIADKSAKIERLTEENGQLKGYNNGLEYENIELQKQVEAWKARAKEIETAWEISSSNEVELQKQVDELRAGLNRVMNEHDKMASYAQSLEEKNEQAVKDTAKEIFDGLAERKERVKAFYGTAESVGVDIAIRAVKEIVKQKGIEVE